MFAAFAVLLSVRHFHHSNVLVYSHIDIQASQAVRDVSASYDALVDLFESIDRFLARLSVYTTITLTPLMTDTVVKIMVEIVSTLALATKQVKQGRLSESYSRKCDLSYGLNATQRNS